MTIKTTLPITWNDFPIWLAEQLDKQYDPELRWRCSMGYYYPERPGRPGGSTAAFGSTSGEAVSRLLQSTYDCDNYERLEQLRAAGLRPRLGK